MALKLLSVCRSTDWRSCARRFATACDKASLSDIIVRRRVRRFFGYFVAKNAVVIQRVDMILRRKSPLRGRRAPRPATRPHGLACRRSSSAGSHAIPFPGQRGAALAVGTWPGRVDQWPPLSLRLPKRKPIGAKSLLTDRRELHCARSIFPLSSGCGAAMNLRARNPARRSDALAHTDRGGC